MWEIDLNDQIVTFLLGLLMGGIFCLLFDLTRTARLFFKCSTAAVFFLDLFYFILIAFIDFCFLLVRCNGEIRGYVLFSELSGFSAVRFTLSKLLLTMLTLLLGFLSRVKRRVDRILSAIFGRLEAVFNKIGHFFVKITKKLINCLKKGLKKQKTLVYTRRNKRRTVKDGSS